MLLSFGHAQIECRQTPTLDLASSTNNKCCLPTTTIITNLANSRITVTALHQHRRTTTTT
jgi:hypothetical protein